MITELISIYTGQPGYSFPSPEEISKLLSAKHDIVILEVWGLAFANWRQIYKTLTDSMSNPQKNRML